MTINFFFSSQKIVSKNSLFPAQGAPARKIAEISLSFKILYFEMSQKDTIK